MTLTPWKESYDHPRLSDFTFTFHFHALEKEMATHSSVLAWRIPGMGEPGGLPSMGPHRVGHDPSDTAAAAHSILKSRDITLLTKFHLVKAMVFPVVMYEYDGAQSLSPVQLFATPWTSLQPIRLLCPWI